jgi:ATP-dependent DNA helicase RecG
METMVRTNDGFEIAEVDLQLRGPGDIEGTRQSGLMNFKIADIIKDQKIVALSRDAARTILEEDPELRADKHQILIKTLEELNQGKTNWSKIS